MQDLESLDKNRIEASGLNLPRTDTYRFSMANLEGKLNFFYHFENLSQFRFSTTLPQNDNNVKKTPRILPKKNICEFFFHSAFKKPLHIFCMVHYAHDGVRREQLVLILSICVNGTQTSVYRLGFFV